MTEKDNEVKVISLKEENNTTENSNAINEGQILVFRTLGEFRKGPLNDYVLEPEIIDNIKAAVNGLKVNRKHINYFAIDNYQGSLKVICILQGKSEIELEQGKYKAYSYNCVNQEQSKLEDIIIRKNWDGSFTMAEADPIVSLVIGR